MYHFEIVHVIEMYYVRFFSFPMSLSTRAALKLQRKAGLRRSEALHPSTRDPWTKDFKHLLPLPRHWTKSPDPRQQAVRAVPPRDRIKYWNIVPGDQIRIRGDRGGAIHEVQAINKLRNRVYLRSKAKVRNCKAHHSSLLRHLFFSG